MSSTAKATADAECEIPGSKAKAHAEAYGSASASAEGYAEAATLVQAIANAKKNGQKLAKIDADAQASATATSSASSTATADVLCESTTQPPVTPPEVQKPTINIQLMNDLDLTTDEDEPSRTPVCADYEGSGNEDATIKFYTIGGSFVGASTFTKGGDGEVCTSYQAPTELPDDQSTGKDGVQDKVWVTIKNSSGSSTSTTFVTINPTPVIPA